MRSSPNTDDHPRNHAILAADAQWGLSPAYDLTPNTPVNVERRDLALIAGDAGRFANAENMLSQCARFLLATEEAADLIAHMKEAVRSTWYATARGEGITERDCELIARAFVYEGFDLPLPPAT